MQRTMAMHRNAWARKAIKGAIFRPDKVQLSFSSRRVHIVSAEEIAAYCIHSSSVNSGRPRPT